MKNIKETIKNYLCRTISEKELSGDEDIFELGLVHSLFAMQLILFIEKEFDIELDEDDFDFDKLRTMNDIVQLIESKIG